jgi:hypothetical protein
MANPKPEQIALAEALQDALLKDFERLLKDGQMTPADRATLSRLLRENGWSLDPAALPEGIRSKLTKRIDPKSLADEEAYDA